MRHEFDATIQRLEGKMAWPVLYVPFDLEETYGTKGRLNVIITLDGHGFQGTLLPSKHGHYIVYNQFMKAACKKEMGDSIHIVMEPDLEPRMIEIPDDLQGILATDHVVFEEYEKLPDYMKREEVNKIQSAKKPETRQNRIQKLIEKLRQRSNAES